MRLDSTSQAIAASTPPESHSGISDPPRYQAWSTPPPGHISELFREGVARGHQGGAALRSQGAVVAGERVEGGVGGGGGVFKSEQV